MSKGQVHALALLLPASERDLFLHADAVAHGIQAETSSLPVMLENVSAGHGVHSFKSLPGAVL